MTAALKVVGAREDHAPREAGNVALVVDDDRVNRIIMRCLLEDEGFRVVEANDGHAALTAFAEHTPDIVFMDVMMPGIDGHETVRRLRATTAGAFVPVIFLTLLTNEEDQTRCLDAGGDDVLTKPYSPMLLRAKIRASMRAREMYRVIARQRDEMTVHREQMDQEVRFAQRILGRITRAGQLEAGNVRHLLEPLEILNGDILLGARKPSGAQVLMLGDTTGHGLPAAVCAMVVCDVFYAMADKGFALAEMAGEMNRKLRGVLPTGMFMSAALVELDAEQGHATIWNGGLPDVLVLDSAGAIRARIPSMDLPLGVADTQVLDLKGHHLTVSADDRILVFSDGLPEARNTADSMFGVEGIEAALVGLAPECWAVDAIRSRLEHYVGNAPRQDDLTLLEVRCDPVLAAAREAAASIGASRAPARWRVTMDLDASALRVTDPVPQLLQTVIDLQGLGEHRQRLYVILTELYSNALEHGLLGLESGLKRTPDGFAEYYERRESALAALMQGTMRIEVAHEPAPDGGRLVLKLAHDGQGFDARATAGLDANRSASGRGIALVRSLSDTLDYSGDGRTATASVSWRALASS